MAVPEKVQGEMGRLLEWAQKEILRLFQVPFPQRGTGDEPFPDIAVKIQPEERKKRSGRAPDAEMCLVLLFARHGRALTGESPECA